MRLLAKRNGWSTQPILLELSSSTMLITTNGSVCSGHSSTYLTFARPFQLEACIPSYTGSVVDQVRSSCNKPKCLARLKLKPRVCAQWKFICPSSFCQFELLFVGKDQTTCFLKLLVYCCVGQRTAKFRDVEATSSSASFQFERSFGLHIGRTIESLSVGVR